MNDLQQMSLDLKQVTSRSLLIIDEFGKGTSESGLCSSFFCIHIEAVLTTSHHIDDRRYWAGMRNPRTPSKPTRGPESNRRNSFPRDTRERILPSPAQAAARSHGGPAVQWVPGDRGSDYLSLQVRFSATCSRGRILIEAWGTASA